MSKIGKLLRKATIFGVALTSSFGAPMPVMKTRGDGEDEESRTVEEDGIVSSEFLTQGQWNGWTALDEHLYCYESLENLVGMENEIDGRFWKTATLLSKEENSYTLRGVRNDGVEFSVDKKFDIRDRHIFDQLCQEFNKKLSVETA